VRTSVVAIVLAIWLAVAISTVGAGRPRPRSCSAPIIVVVLAAAVVLLVVQPSRSTREGWWGVLAWNIFGFADMLLMIVTGIRLGAVAPEQFALFRRCHLACC
jgi:hypothetical protein